MIKTILDPTQTLSTITSTQNGPSLPGLRCKTFSAQCNITVNTPANKTFVDANVNTGTDRVTITSHGFLTGLAVTLTTTGTLPGGLALATTYYLIVVDANTIKFASSLVNALAGTAIDITSAAGGGTHTVNVTALASASVQLVKSNDNVNWSTDGSPVSVTATGTYWLEKVDVTSLYMAVKYSLASGSYSSSTIILGQGDEP